MLWSEHVDQSTAGALLQRLFPIQILDALPHLVWVATVEGSVVFCNARWYTYTGAIPASIHDGGFINYIHPNDYEEAAEIRRRGMELGRPADVQLRWRDHHGCYRWFLDQMSGLRAANGQLLGWLGISTNIDGQKRMEHQQRSSFENFELLARATNELLWEWDLSSGRVWYNRHFWELVGRQPSLQTETVEFWLSLIHPDDRSRVQAELHGSMTTSQALLTSEYRLRRADGTYLNILDRACVVHDGQGQPSRMVGAMKDISALRLRTMAISH